MPCGWNHCILLTIHYIYSVLQRVFPPNVSYSIQRMGSSGCRSDKTLGKQETLGYLTQSDLPIDNCQFQNFCSYHWALLRLIHHRVILLLEKHGQEWRRRGFRYLESWTRLRILCGILASICLPSHKPIFRINIPSSLRYTSLNIHSDREKKSHFW